MRYIVKSILVFAAICVFSATSNFCAYSQDNSSAVTVPDDFSTLQEALNNAERSVCNT